MAEEARKLGFTWQNYQSWNDDERWELIDGEPYAMTPAPMPRHQRVLARLGQAFERFFDGRLCVPFPAPIDVHLSDLDVVQPDISVVCNKDQIRRTHIEGAPALIVEVLSPSTEAYDRVRKMKLYAEKGVREVWLVTPYPWLVEVYVLAGGKYVLESAYEKHDTLVSPTFPELRIELEKVFDFPIPPEEQIEMVHEGVPPYPPQSTQEKNGESATTHS